LVGEIDRLNSERKVLAIADPSYSNSTSSVNLAF
jgi:hypothetical protein